MMQLRGLVAHWLRLPWWLRSLLPVAMVATLWSLSSASPSQLPASPWGSWLHNAAHVVAYALLSAAVFCSASRAQWLALPAWRRLSVLLAAVYGLVDELHQSQVPGRVCSVLDWCSDFLGSMLGVILVVHVWEGGGRGLWASVVLGLSAVSVAMATLLPW